MKVKTPSRTPSLRGKNRSSVLQYSYKMAKNYSLAVFLVLGGAWGIWLIYVPMPDSLSPVGVVQDEFIQSSSSVRRNVMNTDRDPSRNVSAEKDVTLGDESFLGAFYDVLERAKNNRNHCNQVIQEHFEEPDVDTIAIANMTTARLHGFGVIEALEDWRKSPKAASHIANGASYTQCAVPPENECRETQFTVIFMAYNPDRLTKLMRQIRTMLAAPYSNIVREIVLVWNGPREIAESQEGQQLLDYVKQVPDHLRVVYPLKQGLPNDLMNRYHPDIVRVKTKGILYYDDDGPFYSYEAVLGGFELWKRNANAQIGAMARLIDLGPRQLAEKAEILKGDTDLNDRAFISHCAPDDVEYNFRYFANFQANMVLASGSFLESNYLCFLWHPVFEPIRGYIRAHPVHPDDITVSMMVSQLAGRAPKVYSRRINMETKEAQLQEAARLKAAAASEQRRRLLFNINWDANHNMDDSKEKWAQLRSGAVNSLVRYFGSMNSGSIGWCYGTEYHSKTKQGEDICEPDMARFGKLPWMNIDHTPKDSCP